MKFVIILSVTLLLVYVQVVDSYNVPRNEGLIVLEVRAETNNTANNATDASQAKPPSYGTPTKEDSSTTAKPDTNNGNDTSPSMPSKNDTATKEQDSSSAVKPDTNKGNDTSSSMPSKNDTTTEGQDSSNAAKQDTNKGDNASQSNPAGYGTHTEGEDSSSAAKQDKESDASQSKTTSNGTDNGGEDSSNAAKQDTDEGDDKKSGGYRNPVKDFGDSIDEGFDEAKNSVSEAFKKGSDYFRSWLSKDSE